MVSLFKEKKNIDVLICGAGPVGVFLANELADFEINFRIIEKVEKNPEFSKALLVSPRTLEILDNRGLLHPFLEYGVKIKQFSIIQNVHDPSNPIKIELSSMNSNFSFGLMNRQNKTVDYLIDALHEKKSMRKKHVPNVEFCMELIKYEEKDDHVIAVVKNTKSNVEEEIICQYLVGCDGVHSTVRKGINGWTFEGQTLKSSWALADVEIDHELVKYDQATSFVLNEGPIAAIPLDARKNTYRLVVKIGDENKNETNDHVTHGLTNKNHITLEELQKLIDERIAPIKLELKNPVWISNFKINERIVNRYRTGRVFIAGDAAHCHSPLGGQGMNLGIQDAHNLAFKLALVIRDQAADVNKLLDSYEHERYPVGKNVIEGTGFATKMVTGNDYITSFLRTRIAPILFHFFPQTVFKFQNNLLQNNLNYLPESSEILHKYKPRSGAENQLIEAGHYVQDGLLMKITSHKVHERITMFDVFRSTALKHTLILFTLNKGVTSDCNPLIETLLEIYNDYKNTITPIIISYQGVVQTADIPFMPFQEEGREQHIFVECKFELHEKYGVTKEFGQQAFVLIRPDLYIASAVFEDDVDKLKSFLDQYLVKADR
ncbi:FAD binding domain-containing protein [Gigaspora margarita]|uniref:FAD binding domain-containing protein n=2 Tax=Gigaspora margarita TaxID=4874 RepID=A0A8H4AWI8_GIGMA|nr:FAD binding domain-containing protein [Gigaspora margarita]